MSNTQLGIVISNQTGSEELFTCISSVLQSTFTDYDIYVIESTNDDTLRQSIRETFGTKIQLIEDNSTSQRENFLLGIHTVLEKEYTYLCCISSTIRLEAHALETMVHFLCANPSVGIVSGKTLHEQMPAYIQQYGITLDFKHFKVKNLYADTLDSKEIPNIIYCDTLSLCCAMMPLDAVRSVGLPSAAYYMHWDDIEWGFRFKQAGYEVVCLGDAKLYHLSSAKQPHTTTLEEYYFTRNCLYFFMNYTKPDDCTKMSIILLKAVFEMFYLHKMSQAHNMAQADLSALLDVIHGITGKAPDNRILTNDESGLAFITLFEELEAVYLEDADPFLEEIIRQIHPDMIFLTAPKTGIPTIKKCDSILQLQQIQGDEIYLDHDYHLAATTEDIQEIKNYEQNLQLFLYMMQPALLRRIEELREIEL